MAHLQPVGMSMGRDSTDGVTRTDDETKDSK